jgi:hypothetical protein
VKPEHTRNLAGRTILAVLAAAAVASAARGQNLPVTVGQEHDAAVSALRAKGIAFQETTAGDGRTATYKQGDESVTLDFAPWPKDGGSKALTLTRIRDEAPSSSARRAWVNSLAREGRGWSYLTPEQDGARTAAVRGKYPVAAGLQWTAPPAHLLFQAARAAGSAPGTEATELVIELTKPRAAGRP